MLTRVPSGYVGAMIAASRHCAKVDSASACGGTWKSLAMMKGEGARAVVCADGGKDGGAGVTEATAYDNVGGLDDDWRGSAEVNCDGDGASKDWSARAERACGALADEDSDAPREPEPQPVRALAI